MTDRFGLQVISSARKRAQMRQAAEIMGLSEDYIARMVRLFAARVAADRQLGQVCGAHAGCGGEGQVERMTAFWSAVALHTEGYTGDLVAVHRNLSDLQARDFERWLELFRATLDETAPTRVAADYLMSRAERIAAHLEAAICEHAPRAGPDREDGPAGRSIGEKS
ncbi:MAG: group III truncated hemoglobin [Roseovarius sp.]|nr:group III truncated hemoglobin [Roseovarius sp.]